MSLFIGQSEFRPGQPIVDCRYPWWLDEHGCAFAAATHAAELLFRTRMSIPFMRWATIQILADRRLDDFTKGAPIAAVAEALAEFGAAPEHLFPSYREFALMEPSAEVRAAALRHRVQIGICPTIEKLGEILEQSTEADPIVSLVNWTRPEDGARHVAVGLARTADGILVTDADLPRELPLTLWRETAGGPAFALRRRKEVH